MVGAKGSIIITTVLACLILIVIAVPGETQERTVAPEGPSIEKQPTKRAPFENPARQRAGLVVISDLNVDTAVYKGPCPAVFNFKGQIYSNKPVNAHYRFIRSDRVSMKPVEIRLEKEKKREVSHAIRFGDPKGPAEFSEWAYIQVLFPINLKTRSNVVFIKGTCTNHDIGKGRDVQKEQPSTGPTLPQSETKVPMPAGTPQTLPGQMAPSSGNLPMMPPAQKGQMPIMMPTPQSGQKGPMAVEPPVPDGKGPVPGGFPMSQPEDKKLPGPGQ